MYIVLSWHSDGSDKPELTFHREDADMDVFIARVVDASRAGKMIEVYAVETEGSYENPLRLD